MTIFLAWENLLPGFSAKFGAAEFGRWADRGMISETLKKVPRKEGTTWVLRFRVSNAGGRRVEHTLPVGLVRDFPKSQDAWREVDRLGLATRVNSDAPLPRPHQVGRHQAARPAALA